MLNNSIPKLAPSIRLQTDRVTGDPILLGPEVVLKLTENAGEILSLCDGERDLETIAANLAVEYDAHPETVLLDTRLFLERLASGGYIVWGP